MSATLALRDVPEVARMDASVLARVLGALLQATVLCAGLAAALTVEARRQLSPPGVVPLDLYSVFARTDLVQVTVRAGWTPLIAWVPYDTVLRDPTLWRRMQFQDWDRLDEAPREAGLQAMVARYGHVREEAVWPTMRAVDWDAVPQPVRAMAYLEMAAYWARHYGVGHEYGLSLALTGDTLGAIIMVESWFEHRSAVIGASGNLDVGIGQCSDYCRAALVQLAAAGQIDFAPATIEAYGNPLHASRAAALWFGLMLDEADGDLELAVRAYYRGMPAARAGEGAEYLRNVLDKRERFVRNQAGTPAWRVVYRKLRSVRPARRGIEDAGAARNQPLEIRQRSTVHAGEARDVQFERQHGVFERPAARALQPAEIVPRQGAAELNAVDGPASGDVHVCHGPMQEQTARHAHLRRQAEAAVPPCRAACGARARASRQANGHGRVWGQRSMQASRAAARLRSAVGTEMLTGRAPSAVVWREDARECCD